MSNANAEGPVPGDEFVFMDIDEAGEGSWILINYIAGANEDDAGEYVFRSADDPRVLMQLPVSQVMEALESENATYTPHSEEHGGKGVAVFGLEAGAVVEVFNDDGEPRAGRIISTDTETDSFEIVWSDMETENNASPIAETIHFEESGLLPEGITNIVLTGGVSNTEMAENNAEVAPDNTVEVAPENTAEVAENNTEVAENNNTEVAENNNTEVAENNTEVAENNTEVAAVAAPDNTEETANTENFEEIDIVQELDAALRTYTEEEQEQSFIDDWIQHPLADHPNRLLTSRFALIDLFRTFQLLVQDRIDDDDSVIRIRNPHTRPFPLMPLSHVETVIYTDPNHGEQANVHGLVVRSSIDDDVENFAQNLMSNTEAIVGGKTYDTMMHDMFDATQPWLVSDLDHDDPYTTEVTRDIPFMRITAPIDESGPQAPLRVGAWKGIVEKEGSQRIRVFLGHQVAPSEQRAVAGLKRTQPDSGNIVASMPADVLRTDGYLYVPQPGPRNDWLASRRSRVLLYDIRRSQPHITADHKVIFGSSVADAIPVYTTAEQLADFDFRAPAVLKTDLIDNLPPLDAYLSSIIGQKDSPLISGWHDLQTILDYVGRDTQSLPAAAHVVVATALERSVAAIEANVAATDAAADAAIAAVREAAVDAGHRGTLALLNYANPLDKVVQEALPPEIVGISHWGLFSYSAEAWVRFGFTPEVERYWINKIRSADVAAAIAAMMYPARRVTQHIAARQLETDLLGHPRAEHNPCPHVPFADRAYTETSEEIDGNLLAVRRILDRFGGKRDANWVYCFQCKKTLVCAHDLLLLDAQAHPEDSDLIMKQIILRFGQHGIEGRAHMCGNCGKEWHGLSFDTDPLLAGGRGEEEGEAMIVEEPDPDDVEWAATEGYDGMWTDEGEVAAVAEEAAAEEDGAVAEDFEAEEVIQETKTPLSKYPVAYRILRDIAGLAGINLTYEAEEKLVEAHVNFPRRPALRGRVKKDIEESVIRYLARYAACLVVLARQHPALLPVRVGAAIGASETDEDAGEINERMLARIMARATMKHTPWRQLTQLAASEAKAIKDRTDEFFRQINKAVRSIVVENEADQENSEEAAAAAAAALKARFRVRESFRPRLFASDEAVSAPDLSLTAGSSVITYYTAIHTLMEALISAAAAAPATPEQMGAHYIAPGLPIPEALEFFTTLAAEHEELAGIPEYIVEAGGRFDAAFNRRWVRTYLHVPLQLFPIDKPSELVLTETDWRILFTKACATGTNTGGPHRFLRSGHCVYCGIPRPTEAEPAVVPSAAAGQALLDAIRRRNIVPADKKQGVSELMMAAESIIEIFPGKALTQNPVFAIIALALKPAKGDVDVTRVLGQSLKQLETRPPAGLDKADVLKGLCRNPHAACRDIMQFIALPLARWARADDALLKVLRTIRSDYGLYMDHKRDVEGFFVAQQGRLPKIPRSDALVAAASDTARRIRALCKMRELWTTRIERQLRERGVGEDMDVSNIVFNMFYHTVLTALSPWFTAAAAAAAKGQGRLMIDYINGAIGDWYVWGQKVQLSAVTDVLLRHAEAEKDMLLREYESRNYFYKRILGEHTRLHIGRYEAGDVKRMDMAVYKRDAGLAAKLAKQVEGAVAR